MTFKDKFFGGIYPKLRLVSVVAPPILGGVLFGMTGGIAGALFGISIIGISAKRGM